MDIPQPKTTNNIAYVVIIFSCLGLLFLVMYQNSHLRDQLGTQATSTPPVVCENLIAQVKVTEVFASSTPQLTKGVGTVILPADKAGQQIPFSIEKAAHLGQVVNQCINIVVE